MLKIMKNNYLMKKYNINVNILNNITLTEYGHIYMIKNIINNKSYIGQSIRVKERLSEHIQNLHNNKQTKFYNSINKHGIENFKFNIIDYADNIDDLNKKEIKYILEYKSNIREFGYNIEEGGKNSKASAETKLKLSLIRRNKRQNSEWIQKRIDTVAKPVLKIDLINNIILEKYSSLADAGRNNLDDLSYQQINRKCLAYTKNKNNWCYEEDYLNNTIKEHKTKTFKKLSDFDNELINKIYGEYKNNISVMELSKIYSIRFSVLNKIIKNIEKPVNSDYDLSKNYILTCKKTGKTFTDFTNKSGALTVHISNNYPDLVLPTLFKRKQIELNTGKPWYYEYFDFKEV